jgi:hypothetical protein
MKNPKIEVHLVSDTDPDNQDTPYFYCVLDWGDGPTWWNGWNSDEPKSIMPGTERGSWYNTGICGWAATPEQAFAEGLTRYRKHESQIAN